MSGVHDRLAILHFHTDDHVAGDGIGVRDSGTLVVVRQAGVPFGRLHPLPYRKHAITTIRVVAAIITRLYVIACSTADVSAVRGKHINYTPDRMMEKRKLGVESLLNDCSEKDIRNRGNGTDS